MKLKLLPSSIKNVKCFYFPYLDFNLKTLEIPINLLCICYNLTMKVALLLPGYLDSPNYLHMLIFEQALIKLGYVVERLDPCQLWETNDVKNYLITNYIAQVKERVDFYSQQHPEEIILIGHSLGGFTAIVAGSMIKEVTRIIALCPPPDRVASSLHWEKNQPRHSERELPDNSEKFKTFDIPYAFVTDGMQYSAAEAVKSMYKPIMIFIALDDQSVPPADTEKIVSNANAPYVVRQPNMKHSFRTSKKECDLVMNEIKKFLVK